MSQNSIPENYSKLSTDCCFSAGITFRKPKARDGLAIWKIIQSCPPLDTNSKYCNVLQCDLFSDTSVLACMDGKPIGWLSAFREPKDDNALFVWQVAVLPASRGKAVGAQLLRHLFFNERLQTISRLRTTITRENHASRAMFLQFSDNYGGHAYETECYDERLHFDGSHQSEYLLTIVFEEPPFANLSMIENSLEKSL